MSTPCYLCSSDVYEAEKKLFDGKTFHGVCFGKWKKGFDKELADIRNAEYYKVPDVSTTKIRESNYNTVIYATQYLMSFDKLILAQGTQPNEAHLLEMLSSPRRSNTSPSPTWAPTSSTPFSFAPPLFVPPSSSRSTPSPTPPSLSASAPETSSSVTVVSSPCGSNTSSTFTTPRTWRPRSQSVNSSNGTNAPSTIKPEHATISAIPSSGSSPKERSPSASPTVSKRTSPHNFQPTYPPPSSSKSPKSPPRTSWPKRVIPSLPLDSPSSPLPVIVETPSSPTTSISNVPSAIKLKENTKRGKQRCTSLPPIRRNKSPFRFSAPPSSIVPSIPPLQHILGDHRSSQNYSKPFERQYATSNPSVYTYTPHPIKSPRSPLASVPTEPSTKSPPTNLSALESIQGKAAKEASESKAEKEEDQITATELSSLLTNIVHFIKPSELPFSPTTSFEGHGVTVVRPSPLTTVPPSFSPQQDDIEDQGEQQSSPLSSSTSFRPYSPTKNNCDPPSEQGHVVESTSPSSTFTLSTLPPASEIIPQTNDPSSELANESTYDFIPINDDDLHNKSLESHSSPPMEQQQTILPHIEDKVETEMEVNKSGTEKRTELMNGNLEERHSYPGESQSRSEESQSNPLERQANTEERESDLEESPPNKEERHENTPDPTRVETELIEVSTKDESKNEQITNTGTDEETERRTETKEDNNVGERILYRERKNENFEFDNTLAVREIERTSPPIDV